MLARRLRRHGKNIIYCKEEFIATLHYSYVTLAEHEIYWRIIKNRSLDIEINEKCSFCNGSFTRLRALNKHINKCNVKKTQEKDGISLTMKQLYLIEQRKRLSHKATKQLDRYLNTAVNVKEWETLAYESRRKRRRFN